MIICLSGQKRTGKDSCADVLVAKYNFKKLSLADPIRELGQEIFDIPISVFNSDELKEKPFKEPIFLEEWNIDDIVTYVEDVWNMPVSTATLQTMRTFAETQLNHPRHVLQFVGTELLRNNIDDSIFLKLAARRMRMNDGHFVIADCRFSNERAFFKEIGATLCLIKRPTIHYIDTHMSENDLGTDDDYDVIMTNDGSLNSFKLDVSEWINTKLLRISF
jgi:hypothetical protein